MKKTIVFIFIVVLLALLIGNVYAQGHRSVKYVHKPAQVQNTIWVWTDTRPYYPVPAMDYSPPISMYVPVERPCLACLHKIITCPFRVLERLLFE